MNVAVLGLGYVGCVSAACLARDGHAVVGVDNQPEKVEIIRQGIAPVSEPGLAELIAQAVEEGRLRGTDDLPEAVRTSKVLLVCVGTPCAEGGALDTRSVQEVCEQIACSLPDDGEYRTVAIRSTILPGTAEKLLIPALEQGSARRVGEDFGFCVNPEFLREGTAVHDFYHPPFTLIGTPNCRSAPSVESLYEPTDVPVFTVPLGVAEMVKYSSNVYHALKITFANEVGRLCSQLGIDSHAVMDVFRKDRKLNLGPCYLRPGFAFGGSCLPKDLRAVLSMARGEGLDLPVIEAVLPSNERQIQKAADMIAGLEVEEVALIGMAYKANTDDMRKSPAVKLAKLLQQRGMRLRLYDERVDFSKIMGSNADYIRANLPRARELMYDTIEEAIDGAAAVVIAKKLTDVEERALVQASGPNQKVVDLVHVSDRVREQCKGEYLGIT